MLTRDDYQAALDVQSAVNLSAVVISFAEIMRRIGVEAHMLRASGCVLNGNEWRNRHPIVRLFAEAFAELSGSGMTAVNSSWYEADQFCQRAAAGLHAHLVITVRGNEVVEYEVKGDA